MLKSIRTTVSFMAIILLTACATAPTNTENGESSVNISPGTRTLGTLYDDQYIETTATKLIRKASIALDESRLSVVSVNSIVLLVGQVPDELSRNQAAQVVQTIPNIRQVHNNLTIGPPISLLSRANDTLITTHLKSMMIGETLFPSTRVKVVTEDSVVYLMGLVTQEEANWAVRITQRGSGIKKIVKVFEYIN